MGEGDKIEIKVGDQVVGIVGEFRATTLAEDIERGKIRTLSMGTRTESSREHEYGKLAQENQDRVLSGLSLGPRIISASVVPAPECTDCKEPMTGQKPCHWVCDTEDCPESGSPVDALYHCLPTPMFPVD